MHNILSKRHLPTLTHFATSNVLLAFDYDSTLAPLAEPNASRLPRTTRRLLTGLASRYPCLVISGRRHHDVIRCFAGIPVWCVFGRRATERIGDDSTYPEPIQEWVIALPGSSALGGHVAVNAVSHLPPHKGIALERARRLLVCDAAIYVGDDDTDEEAFFMAATDRLLAIRVGASRQAVTRYCLKAAREIDALLQTLLRLRPGRAAAAG